MTADPSRSYTRLPAREAGFSRLLTLVVCLGLALVGALAGWLIFATEPGASREAAVRQTAMLVSVTRPEAGDFRPNIVATGTVQPAREITLRPRVSGEIAAMADSFVPGGRAEQGEVLVRLEAADYRNTLAQRESELAQAEADLAIEEGRQAVAERDYAQAGSDLSPENEALVLREPQRRRAEAQVAIARTAVEQAQLELARTRIQAPFDAQVVTREINVGSQVAAGDALGRLVGVDTYWVEASVPVSRLPWLAFGEESESGGSPVVVQDRAAWPEGMHREGRLLRLVGELDATTRLARVQVAVEDPLLLADDAPDRPRLMLGAFVELSLSGREITDVVRVSRDYIRQNDTIWLMRDDRLVINDVDIVFEDAEYAYIRSGVSGDDRVVTSNLATVEDGVRLRLEDESADGSAEEAPAS